MFTIDYDFQGWPVSALNLREILLEINGFKEEDGKIFIDSKEEILNAYPRLLEDDGMAYGVKEQFITDVDNEVYRTHVVDDKSGYYDLKNGLDKEEIIDIPVFNVFRNSEVKKVETEDNEKP